LTNVRGYRVLIVEDEYVLAQDLSRYFRNMGAIVLGPTPDIEAAGKHLEYADAAVLDVDLKGQKVFPVADELARRGIPFVFFTGRSDIAIPIRFRHAGLLTKPVDTSAVFHVLFPSENSGERVSDDVLSILPKLRLAALLLMENAGPADRLVELTLERAIATIHTRDDYPDAEAWLTGILEDTHRRSGRNLLP
jgi:CheY-like chemotaxis protein